jgi:hypothetical protein
MVAFSVVSLLLYTCQLQADDPKRPSTDAADRLESSEKQNIEAALSISREAAGKYDFEIRDAVRPPTLREQPILRWSNPERGQIYGNVFLWTQQGRPVVVGSLFKWFSPFTHMSHEFHSLSEAEFQGVYDGQTVWRCPAVGITFAAIPDAPAVGSTAAARLTQMRQMARQFSARTTDREGLQIELRLLTQPVYRYELTPGAGDPSDGALFAFVQGTDPELWLLLEARPSEKRDAWQFALARMNSIAVDVECNSMKIWHRDALPSKEIYGHQAAYTSFRFDRP